MLLVPLFLTNTDRDIKSDFDNRVLAELPEFGESGYAGKIKSYLQDRIGFRDQIVTGYQLLNRYVAGELTHPSYTYGQDGYMFFKMHNNVQYGDYHKTFAEAVLKMKDYCESRNAKFYFMLDPEKISVYRRYLPVGVNYNDEWVDELLTYMKELGIVCINNKDLLIEYSYEKQVFNHQYDAGHWNDLGSYYATNNLWSAVHDDFPNVIEYTEDDFYISTRTGDYLASSRFPVNETIPYYSPKYEWKDRTSEFSAVKRHDNYQYIRLFENVSDKAEDYPRMLVFHGSYYNRKPEFFVGRSKEYIGIHDYQNVLDLDYYFTIFQPEVVVFEVAEYTFTDRYFDSGKMKSLDYNPCLVKDEDGSEAAIETAKRQAEWHKTESGSDLYLIHRKGFDEVYMEKDYSSIKYAYLFAENRIYDLKKDDHSLLTAGIPKGSIGNTATLFYEDYYGNTYYTDIEVKSAVAFSTESDYLSCSDGVAYDAGSDSFCLTTELRNNSFNAVNIQLLDGMTGKYLYTIYSAQSTGAFKGSFVHNNETGLYLMRLKGNTPKQDEGINVLTFLEKGEKYYYSFEVTKLARKRIVFRKCSFWGPGSINYENTELINQVVKSAGVTNDESTQYIMTTELEGNRFSCVVLQLTNTETSELQEPLSLVSDTGVKKGYFYHLGPSGGYFLKLRANSNLKDEYIGEYIELEEGAIYEWSYEVTEITPNRVIVKDISFKILGRKYNQ